MEYNKPPISLHTTLHVQCNKKEGPLLVLTNRHHQTLGQTHNRDISVEQIQLPGINVCLEFSRRSFAETTIAPRSDYLSH